MKRKLIFSLLFLMMLQACTLSSTAATGTATEVVTATEALPTPTPQPVLPTAVTNEDGTLTVTVPFTATLTEVAGPYTGKLIGQTEFVPNDCASVNLENFMMEVTFTNPGSVAPDGWDYGIFFRDQGENNQLRLILYDYGWYLSKGIEDSYASGDLVYDATEGGSNLVQLFVLDGTAYLYLNWYQQAKMDVSTFPISGDVCVAGWTYQDDPKYIPIGYDNFSVWKIE